MMKDRDINYKEIRLEPKFGIKKLNSNIALNDLMEYLCINYKDK